MLVSKKKKSKNLKEDITAVLSGWQDQILKLGTSTNYKYIQLQPIISNQVTTSSQVTSNLNFNLEQPDAYNIRRFYKSNNGVHFPCE